MQARELIGWNAGDFCVEVPQGAIQRTLATGDRELLLSVHPNFQAIPVYVDWGHEARTGAAARMVRAALEQKAGLGREERRLLRLARKIEKRACAEVASV